MKEAERSDILEISSPIDDNPWKFQSLNGFPGISCEIMREFE